MYLVKFCSPNWPAEYAPMAEQLRWLGCAGRRSSHSQHRCEKKSTSVLIVFAKIYWGIA